MFDSTTPTTKDDAASSSCPKCGAAFVANRKNQQYCSRACQKHASRGPRDAKNSSETRDRNRAHYDRAAWLCHDLHRTAPAERLGFLANLIAVARDADGQLRGILTDPRLLGAAATSPIGKHYPDSRNIAVKNISKAADAYCRKFWGHGVDDVVHRQCPEPPTGEDDDAVGHAPQATVEARPGRVRQCISAAPSMASFDGTFEPICKGWRWLTVSRAKTVKLRKLRGCSSPVIRPRTLEGKPFRGPEAEVSACIFASALPSQGETLAST